MAYSKNIAGLKKRWWALTDLSNFKNSSIILVIFKRENAVQVNLLYILNITIIFYTFVACGGGGGAGTSSPSTAITLNECRRCCCF